MSQTKVAVGMVDATGTPGSGNFLRGDGSWNAPGGGWEFVEKVSASTSSTVDLVEGNIDAGYDYMISCRLVDNSVDLSVANSAELQYGTGGTPTYQTSTYTNQYSNTTGTVTQAARDGTTAGVQIAVGVNQGGTGAGELWGAEILITDPVANAISHAHSFGQGRDSDGNWVMFLCVGERTAATIITGFRILPGTGTFITGDFITSRRPIA